MPDAKPKRRSGTPHAPKSPDQLAFRLQEDGSLSRATAERLALFMADGLTPSDAWLAMKGQRGVGGSVDYRKAIEAYGPFQQRLATLRAEKEALLKDDVFGELKWMVGQMWRDARATGNATMMQKAVELRAKVMERETALMERTGGVPTPAGRPGKPVVENPQTKADVSDLRQRLLAAGAPTPGNPASNPPEKTDTPTVPVQRGQEVVVLAPPEPDLEQMLARVG